MNSGRQQALRSRPAAFLVGILVGIMTLTLLVTGAPAQAAGPDESASSQQGAGPEHGARVGYDLLIIRPLKIVTTGLSLCLAAVAYPASLPFGKEDHVVQYLVNDPIDRTFRQPLGEL